MTRQQFAGAGQFVRGGGGAGRGTGAGRLAVVREQDGQVRGCLLAEGYELAWRGQQLVGPRDRSGETIIP